SVAFALPPSVGPAPSLGLSYSSAGAARGGIAAGWDIQGTSSIRADMGRTTPDGALQYTAYLNGAAFELVPALGDIVGPTGGQNNTAYRPRVDTGDFTRFEKSPGGWRATTKSGLVYTFGGSFVAGGVGAVIGEEYFLANVTDRFSNAMAYFYQPVYYPE